MGVQHELGRDHLLQSELDLERGRVAERYARLDALREEKERQLAAVRRTGPQGSLQNHSERDAFASLYEDRLAQLYAVDDRLVFGRLDLDAEREGGANEQRYIGRIGLTTEDHERLLVDWRAAEAGAFYQATAAHRGRVRRRRHLMLRGREVRDLEDDILDPTLLGEDGVRADAQGALLAAVTARRTGRMGDIVATIQAEQDEVIRAPLPGAVVVQGGPGTGKTAVALHRAAYLLYTHRERLARSGVLIVGPSTAFMRYIERVLPSLGEDSVTLHSMGQVASDVLGFSSDRLDESRAATIKGSLRMVDVLERLVSLPMIADPQEQRLRVTVKAEVLTIPAQQLRTTRSHILGRQPYNLARHSVEQSLLDQLWNLMPADTIVRYDLSREDFDELVTSQASYRMFLNAWWPPLSAPQVLARLEHDEVTAEVAPDWSPEDRGILTASIPPADDGGRRAWSIADIALLDHLAAIMGPAPVDPDVPEPIFLSGAQSVDELVTISDVLTDRRETDETELHDTFAHVLVDEAQDITPMQWLMLRRRGPQSSWTIVGDPAQSAYPFPEETQAAIDALVGSAPLRTFRLSKNYRSPAEVFDLAARVIVTAQPDADLPEAVRSTGVDPVRTTTSQAQLDEELLEQTRILLSQVDGTVGIVVPPALADHVEETLHQLPETDAVHTARQDDRLLVVTTMQAKGLEYDAALVVDPEQIVAQSPGGVRVLYVALTRATQRLVVLGVADSNGQSVDAEPWQQALWQG